MSSRLFDCELLIVIPYAPPEKTLLVTLSEYESCSSRPPRVDLETVRSERVMFWEDSATIP